MSAYDTFYANLEVWEMLLENLREHCRNISAQRLAEILDSHQISAYCRCYPSHITDVHQKMNVVMDILLEMLFDGRLTSNLRRTIELKMRALLNACQEISQN